MVKRAQTACCCCAIWQCFAMEPDHSDWKRRFTAALAARFVQRGVKDDAALADAEAHADDHFPKRSEEAPELEADLVYLALLA